MPETTPIRKTLVASMTAIGQQTKVVAAETVTDTRWEKGTLGQDAFVPTAQKTQLANYDTQTRTAWEAGTVTVDGRPTFSFSQDVAAFGEALQGVDVRLGGDARLVASQTRVVKAETLTDTHWEVGADGDAKKAQATSQQTRIDNFDTVTRQKWSTNLAWTGPEVAVAPLPRPLPKPQPVVAPISGGTTATRTYRVKEGDYLAKIAREQLGDATRWKEIAALNADRYPSLAKHPERIQPGWTLRLPAKQTAIVVGRIAPPAPVICPPIPVPPPVVVLPPVVQPVICPPMPKPPVVEPPAPVEPPKPTIDAKVERLRRDLDLYLAGPENKDSGAILHVLRTAPQYAEAATAEQKARMIKQVVDGSANGDERRAALKILELADAKGELGATMEQLEGKKALDDVLHDLGDNGEGVAAARLWMKAGLYEQEWFFKAMDDDATSGLVKALGFKEPMIGTSDELRALPEAAKHHMIRELLAGNLTWGELAQAEWLNQHTTIPYRIPDYRNR